MMRSMRTLLVALALNVPLASGALPDFMTGHRVVEYRNSIEDRYLLTGIPQEMAALEGGLAGPGWARTGQVFAVSDTSCSYCPQVVRFRGPYAHFYTANESEIEALDRPGSGWAREGVAFAVPNTPSSGRCLAPSVTVQRLQNGRGPHQVAHRYVTSAAERDAMLARGWLDEGPAFCVKPETRTPISTQEISFPLEGNIMNVAQCRNPLNTGACLAVSNLPTPSQALPWPGHPDSGAYGALIGPLPSTPGAGGTLVTSTNGAPTDRVFAFTRPAVPHFFGPTLGIHLDTAFRGPSPLSSVAAMHQFPASIIQGSDARFLPWRSQANDAELLVTAYVALNALILRGGGSHAYGHPSLDFIDQRSGRGLRFNALAYGTMDGSDFVARDADGLVIVGTTLRDSPYIRNVGSGSLKITQQGLRLHTTTGTPFYDGRFAFFMDRAEFTRVVNAARSVDPGLSADPGDYLLANVSFKNEISGDGKISVRLSDFTLSLLPR